MEISEIGLKIYVQYIFRTSNSKNLHPDKVANEVLFMLGMLEKDSKTTNILIRASRYCIGQYINSHANPIQHTT